MHTPKLLSMAMLASLVVGCGEPAGIRTPRPNLTNAGLNSISVDGEPSLSEDGRYIAFSSGRSGNQWIHLYDTEQRTLVDLPGLNGNDVAAHGPDISADGRYIVYLSNQLGQSEVFLYDRQTREVQNISSRLTGDVRNPSISGNGRFIAFESNRTGQWQIELFDRGADLEDPTPTLPGDQERQ